MKKFLLPIYFILFLTSCFSGVNINKEESTLKEIPLKYASHLKIFQVQDHYIVKIRNPWDTTKTLHTYFIITDKNFKEDTVKKSDNEYTIIKTPVEKALIFTSLHAGLIKNLGAKNSISSLCDVEYILDKELQEDIKSGKIKDLGSSMTPDVEKIIVENPQIIMLSPYQNSGGFPMLAKTKIPIIECADYMENSPLAQAEWIKFYGLLFGKKDFADSIFSSVEENYLNLKKLAENSNKKAKLLPNSLIGAVWYMPAKKSTAAKFYLDAGFEYPFDYLEGFGTVPLNFETVLSKAYDCDIWLVKYNREKDYDTESFSKENPNYNKFKAFKEKNVYFCNLSYIPYYDEIPFQPDLLLKELIKIANPEILKDYQLRYFKKLK